MHPTNHAAPSSHRAAIYARVSTVDQTTENQLLELRTYVQARNWSAVEYVDRGISGMKDRRPALDELVHDARRRRFDVLVCWRLDRLGRNLKHLVSMLEELHIVGVDFVSLHEGIDATTPAGRLQMHVLASIAEFERDRIAERVRAGLERARRDGKRLGRPRVHQVTIIPKGLTVRQAAKLWGTSRATAARRLARGQLPPIVRQTPGEGPSVSPDTSGAEPTHVDA